MSVYCILFLCVQFSAAGSKYLREAQGWGSRGSWVAPRNWGCVRCILGVLSNRPHLTSPWMKSKEIVCVSSQVSLHLNPNRKKLLAAQSWVGGVDTLNMSPSLRQMGWPRGLLAFGHLGSYLHNERFRIFWPVRSYSRAQYLWSIIAGSEVKKYFTVEELKPKPWVWMFQRLGICICLWVLQGTCASSALNQCMTWKFP